MTKRGMTEALTWLILIALWCLMAFILAMPIFYVGATNKAGTWFIVLVPIALLRAYGVKGKIERAIDNSGRMLKEGADGLKEQRRIRKMKKMEEEIKLIRQILDEDREDNNKKE